MHRIKEKCTQGFGAETQRKESEDLDTDVRINTTYRVFHDLWTIPQEVSSEVFMIQKFHINMCPILDG
jgi:hypothetical protein